MGVLLDPLWWLCGVVQVAAFAACKWTYGHLRSIWRWLRSTPITAWIGILLFLAILYSLAPKVGGWRFRLVTFVVCDLACIAMWRRKPLAANWGKSDPMLG